MPGRPSKQSRALAHVRLQLRTGKTRGSNPRLLSSEEVHALEARRYWLQAEMADRQRQRLAERLARGQPTTGCIYSHNKQ